MSMISMDLEVMFALGAICRMAVQMTKILKELVDLEPAIMMLASLDQATMVIGYGQDSI